MRGWPTVSYDLDSEAQTFKRFYYDFDSVPHITN